jgi:WhiB family transcriptional regulator, redox-sensing transcriptional regulator
MTRRRRAVQLPLPLEVPPLPAAVRADLRTEVVPGWTGRAACASRSVDPDWWHAPAGDELQEVARGVCQSCPVRRSCLAHALATGEPEGLWGGADEGERVWMRLALAEGTRVAAVLDPTSRTAAA